MRVSEEIPSLTRISLHVVTKSEKGPKCNLLTPVSPPWSWVECWLHNPSASG